MAILGEAAGTLQRAMATVNEKAEVRVYVLLCCGHALCEYMCVCAIVCECVCVRVCVFY